ncbi:MAG TPA: adenylate kinase [Candidatus Nanoarchaeia archaeon]|nr:adenylate kinase [Candidatus Nanoarchaeia archaeon]
MNLVFLGPPGVGKGTVAKDVVKVKGIPQISTGDLLRAAVKKGTSIGKKAKRYMDEGKLVPDDLVIGLLKDRILEGDCGDGFILDGFPRTIPQAEALEQDIEIDKVINFKASDEMIILRTSGRRVCRNCGAIYHIKNIPPKVPGKCDKCGGELYQREDDNEETVKKRLEVYRQETAPLIEYYRKKGLLIDVETEQPLPQIVADTLKAIG